MKLISLFITSFFFLFVNVNSLADYELLSDADVLSIKTVVSKQLQAFSNDNALEAFLYASPKIQSIFENPNNFIAMVKESYPSVYRPKNINIGTVKILRGIPILHVYLVGPDGNFVTANYSMQKQPNKQWKIDGCIVTKANSNNI
jgi:hypothetical protein